VIKIAIVDDDLFLLRSLKKDIEANPNIEIVFTAGNGQVCLSYLSSFKSEALPDIILMDISMPKMDGIATTREIHLLYPIIQVIMLTVIDQDEKIFEAIKAGAKGYLLKTEKTENIIRAIEDVQKGGTQLTPMIARKMLYFLQKSPIEEMNKDEQKTSPKSKEIPEQLTPRESEILNLLSQGLSYQHIANKLFISLGTLKTHIYHIYEKLQVKNKMQAINKMKKD
jgi:DNA-binding NarL/FixJ family response regulator